jgi:hypothetical protein
MAYRRPNLIWASSNQVYPEVGINGISGNSVVLFPDGQFRIDTSVPNGQSTMTITQNAILSGAKQGGLRTGAVANNTWYAVYAVKSQDDSTTFVPVADTVLPIQANYATLNTNFGVNNWEHLGLIRYGDQGSTPTGIISFVQSGSYTAFTNQPTGQSTADTGFGLVFVTTAGATSLTWTYAAGTSGAVLPNNITFIMVDTATQPTTQNVGFTDSGANAYYALSGNSAAAAYQHARAYIPASKGIKLSTATSVAMDILINGFNDSALGIGPNVLI